MKNFLSLDNLMFTEKNSISNFIKSSSEVSECSISNVLDENSSSIWISNEEFPQKIILNLSRSFFKEYPKKIAAIGIYCWHAYPTNPKLVEILISKNNENNYISFGNFDLCLKPGRQLLQLDDENDSNFLSTENNDYSLQIIIKETYGDKRTYINNIYLYENIDFMSSGNINSFNLIDTIKEEDDSNSIFYLRESRERTLPRKKCNNSVNNNIIENSKIDENNNINNQINSQSQPQSNNNLIIRVKSEEIKNKDLTIDEFEVITKTKNKENKLNDKINNNINVNSNNIFIKDTYDNDNEESNLVINNNLLGTESQFNITEISGRNNNNQIKNNDLTNQNILLTKTNDEIEEKLLNNSNNENKENNKILVEDNNNNDNKLKKKDSNAESLDVTLSSDDLEAFGILKGTKTHHNNFFNPPKEPDSNEELEFQHSTQGYKKIDITNKKIMENYFNMQNFNKNKKINNNKNSQSQKSLKKDEINKYLEKVKNDKKVSNENEIKELKNELTQMKQDFENYKKFQEELNKKYQDKITSLETHIKKLTINSNKMNDVVKTLLEAQYIQNQSTNDLILNQMRQIATETFVNIFSNISQFANASPQNLDEVNINKINEDKARQQTYQTARRDKYSIDKLNKKINNKGLNNIEISDSKVNSKGNKIYNKKINETNIKSNKLKKYNSGRNIALKKNYISNSNFNNMKNYINSSYKDDESIENNKNIEKDQNNENFILHTGYPTEGKKNPFKKNPKIKNINQDEILNIKNNEFDNNILNNKKEIMHKRLLSNYYRKKNSSPIKKNFISFPESNYLYPETTANISNQNKNINFNINENEENDENNELVSDEDVPLKVSQLKTEKKNYNINSANNRNREMNKNEEDKDNENENDNEVRTNSEVRNTYNNINKNKLGDKIINKVIEEQKSIKDDNNNKIINIKKRRTKSKNETLMNLIYQYNNNF